MLEVAIIIEGQDGIGWDRWKGLGLAVEDLVYAGLYRSDHFTEAGVQRVMLQWLGADDLDGLEAVAGSVLPQL
jgi:hypothetical protein